ncbi:MAG: hypothetical protein GOMPHAMPRED_003819 [Gomphillus americanus]|uniref:Uncharacterized protein n=1 Tax=Gomphillus americanus TaxID=1940652 RepID=A0A8H3FLT6_9LECA|nr:MAG: hypothetical protein GOMPHAMPRED_003819 [Gomphillus americanus]
MATQLLSRTVFRSLAARPAATRSFQTSATKLNVAAGALPISTPVGAFRGGLIGFLLGSSVAAYGTYAWVLKEYRLSNELLTEDIYVRMCI